MLALRLLSDVEKGLGFLVGLLPSGGRLLQLLVTFLIFYIALSSLDAPSWLKYDMMEPYVKATLFGSVFGIRPLFSANSSYLTAYYPSQC